MQDLHIVSEEGTAVYEVLDKLENGEVYQRRRGAHSGHTEEQEVGTRPQEVMGQSGSSWRRIVLLILAITIHNIPAGLSEPLLSQIFPERSVSVFRALPERSSLRSRLKGAWAFCRVSWCTSDAGEFVIWNFAVNQPIRAEFL
ncbi:hypothetical protein NFI96_009290 [Prochilodus magdalenae]|nr:hypothetical protein NFI96_009290 [Prochilodus magdalenae]